jgi:hypothetical protein
MLRCEIHSPLEPLSDGYLPFGHQHNQLVDQIADYISSNIKESAFYSFQEFKSVYLTESEGWQEEFGKDQIFRKKDLKT